MAKFEIEFGGHLGKRPLRVMNAFLRDVLGHDLGERSDEVCRTTRTLLRWDKEDRETSCVQHVFARETAKEDPPSKTGGTSWTKRTTEIQRCRFCGLTKQRTQFVSIN